MLVNIKWNKQIFPLEFDPEDGVEMFKSQIYSLTAVPMDRQKLMAKGAWIGTLKDDADLTKMKLKEGHNIMLMGTAEVVSAPTEKVSFIEDMSKSELAEQGVTVSAGLHNLGNTCYMNATVQCFRHMPELREALVPVGRGDMFTSSLRDTFTQLDRSTDPVTPQAFVMTLRSQFPTFAQQGSNGGFMQQDAEEFYNTMVQSVASGLASVNKNINSFIGIEMEEELTCAETTAETTTKRTENVYKLTCNIQGGHGAPVSIDYVQEGLKLGLEGSVEKHSAVLGRNAVWNKTQKISKLPRYLCIHFMRFFWKATPDSMDHSGVKCKIMRPVMYPEIFDAYEFCSDNLQAALKTNRDKAEALTEEHFAKKFKGEGAEEQKEGKTVDKKEELQPDTESVPMDLDTQVNEAVDSSSSSYDFGEGMPKDFRGQYEIMGVVTHKGRSADSGHYIGWVRQEAGSDIWWKYDDDKVTQVGTADILELKGGGDWHTAYLTFYRFKE